MMHKSLEIDLEMMKLLNFNLNRLLTLIKINFQKDKQYLDYEIRNEDIEYLIKYKYIIKSEGTNQLYLRDKGLLTIKKVIKTDLNKEIEKSIVKKETIENLKEKIKIYRSLWKDLRVGSMGNEKACRMKMQRWMKENPEITFEQILKASKLYIESLNGDYRYLQRADYFIFKQNSYKEETSRLSIFIEENQKEIVNSDWGSEII